MLYRHEVGVAVIMLIADIKLIVVINIIVTIKSMEEIVVAKKISMLSICLAWPTKTFP